MKPADHLVLYLISGNGQYQMLQRTEQQNPQTNNQPTRERFFQLLSISGSSMPYKLSIFYFLYFLLSNNLNLIIFVLDSGNTDGGNVFLILRHLFQQFISRLQLIIEMIIGFYILWCKDNFQHSIAIPDQLVETQLIHYLLQWPSSFSAQTCCFTLVQWEFGFVLIRV